MKNFFKFSIRFKEGKVFIGCLFKVIFNKVSFGKEIVNTRLLRVENVNVFDDYIDDDELEDDFDKELLKRVVKIFI